MLQYFMQIVVAAVIERDGLVLIGQRHASKWHGLKWEFPGGKVEPGETPDAALGRELEEELGICAEIGPVIADYEYRYAERLPIRLIFFGVTRFTGEVQNREYHEIRWERRESLPQFDFLDGDLEFVRSLAASSGASPACCGSDST
jgi:8-oxo-dGTP diphosphatase